jgi:hypothetical protein
VPQHVGAESADAGARLKSFEELAHRVAGEGAATTVGEQRLLVPIIAPAVVGDVRVERCEGLDGKVDVAWMDCLSRRGSDVQAPLAEVDVAQAKSRELLPAETAAQERATSRRRRARAGSRPSPSACARAGARLTQATRGYGFALASQPS